MPELITESITAPSATESANAAAHLLAESIAEYCAVTRAHLENVRFLRRGYSVTAPAAPPLEACTHERRIQGSGWTREFDQSYQCAEPGTVTNLRDDTVYCLAHHHSAEDNREPRDAPGWEGGFAANH